MDGTRVLPSNTYLKYILHNTSMGHPWGSSIHTYLLQLFCIDNIYVYIYFD